jgi:hypothetical protein
MYYIGHTRNKKPVYFNGKYGAITKYPLWDVNISNAYLFNIESEAKEEIRIKQMYGAKIFQI